jgi:hypothetical protein
MAKKPTSKKSGALPRLPIAIVPQQASQEYTKRIAEILTRNPKDSEIARLYLGRAGEYFVSSHLLRRGLNCAPLPVDTGVDLLAHREIRFDVPLIHAEHELYQFQIKTTTTNEYRASISVRKLHDLWHKAINLVIIFWSDLTHPKALVLPPSLIRMLTSGGFELANAPLKVNRKEVSIRIIEDGDRYFISNRANEITVMKNRFDRIESIGVDTGMFPNYASWSDGKGLVSLDEK